MSEESVIRNAPAPLILVAEDLEDSRAMYVEYFTDAGYRVEEAEDGAEAIAKTRELRPMVILMDMSMPVVDGWQATEILKTDPETRGVYIIALTGHGEAHFRQRAKEIGVDAFVLKPCLPSDVLKCVKTCIAGHAPGRTHETGQAR